MLRRLAVLLLLVSFATGCTKGGRIAAGSIIAVTGVGLAAATNEMETRSGLFGGTYQSEDHSNDVLGGLLAITGAVLLLSGIAARDDEDRTQTMMIYPPPVAYVPYVAPSVVVDAPSAQTVIYADTVIVQNAPASAALASHLANRLAMQVSTTARDGHCEAALATAKQLAEVDLDLYERLLVTDEAVARCSTR